MDPVKFNIKLPILGVLAVMILPLKVQYWKHTLNILFVGSINLIAAVMMNSRFSLHILNGSIMFIDFHKWFPLGRETKLLLKGEEGKTWIALMLMH